MYDHLQFQSVNREEITDYDKLIEAVNERFQYDSTILEVSKLGISDDGILRFGEKEGRMTQEAFIKFCKQLKIPDPFAKFIPWDLLKYNIDTLTQTIPKAVQVFTREDGTIVNVARDIFTPVPHQLFIEMIKEHAPEIKRGVISDINMAIDVTKPMFGEESEFKNIEPEVGDITETGLNFNNSTSGHNFTSAKLFLFRLVCSNGMSLPTKLGFAKMRTKPGRDLKISVNHFLHELQDMCIVSSQLQREMLDLDRDIDSQEFSKYWKGLDRIVRDPELLESEIFEVDTEERQLYRANDRAFKKHPEDTKLIMTHVNGYKLLNNITLKAKMFKETEKVKMEAYAGKILTNIHGEA